MLNGAQEMAQRAVGKQFRVRPWNDSKVTFSGIIVEASPAGTRRTARSIIQQFKIVLESGVNKTRREFTVSRLPQ